MQFKWRQFAAALVFGCASALAQSAVLVDTGTSSEPGGYSFSNSQYFAGEFTLAQSQVIDSIAGYFSTRSGSVTISLYQDGGAVPGVATSFSSTLATTAGDLAWNGVSGLNWSVGAGTYWVAFVPNFSVSGGEADASMPGFSPNPLSSYAYFDSNSSTWIATSYAVGVRIESAAAVPEPSALMMYGVGIIGLGFMARRKLK